MLIDKRCKYEFFKMWNSVCLNFFRPKKVLYLAILTNLESEIAEK